MAMSFLQKNSDRNLTLKPNTMKTKIKELIEVLIQVQNLKPLLKYSDDISPEHEGEAQAVTAMFNNVDNAILEFTSDSLPPTSIEDSKSEEEIEVEFSNQLMAYNHRDISEEDFLRTCKRLFKSPAIEDEGKEGYWKKRCELTEKCLDESPCDPDITSEQITAHENLKMFIDTQQHLFKSNK